MKVGTVKDAARGRWLELLSELGGLPYELLDGQHHPCPRCGGTDRFRLIDPEAGAVLCNQCFREDNGDGIAAIAWLRDWPFKEALDRVAERLGLEDEGRKKKRRSDDRLQFYGWKDAIVFGWCRSKPGVSLEAVQAQGGETARWKGRYTVVAIPILALDLAVSGWIIWNSTGEVLPRNRNEASKVLVTTGSRTGWVGRWALERMAAAEVVWKVEGPTDLLALWTAIPPELRDRHLVIANPFGAVEKPRAELLEVIRGKTIRVVGDLDAAGKAGAARWAEAIAELAADCRVVPLTAGPWKDIRDWLNAGHGYPELLAAAEAAPGVVAGSSVRLTAAVSPQAGEISPSSPSAAGAESPFSQGDEAVDDPSRLAREFLRFKAKRVACYLDEVYYWAEGRWEKKQADVVRSEVICFLRKEFHRINLEEREAAKHIEGPPKKVRKIDNRLTLSVLTNLKAFCCVPPEVKWGREIIFPEDVGLIDGGEQRHCISLENGVLQVEAFLEGKPLAEILRPHSPSWWSPNKMPYAFDPAAGASRRRCWEGFLARNLEGDPDRVGILQEWAGYCLVPDTSLQRFLILEGEGANGKSVYCAMLEALLGPENVSHVPLELWHNRFALAPTVGRLLNIASEVGEVDRQAEGILKAFVSGDMMNIDRKGREAIEILSFTRLAIATNNRPRFSDRSSGIWRRMLLVPFTVQIPEGERVAGMDKYTWWLRSGEMPAILNWALDGLGRLIQRRRFSESESTKEAVEDYRMESNPAREFLTETFQAEIEGEVKVKDAYKEYRDWCEASGYKPLGNRAFGKEVKRVFVSCRKVKRGPRQAREWHYFGIGRASNRTILDG